MTIMVGFNWILFDCVLIEFSFSGEVDNLDQQWDKAWADFHEINPAMKKMENLAKEILTLEQDNKKYSWKKLQSLQDEISEILKKLEFVNSILFMEKDWFIETMSKLQKASKEHSRLFDKKAKTLVQNGNVSHSLKFLDFKF